MQNYRVDMGAGFHRSTANPVTALSACFPLLFVFLPPITLAGLVRVALIGAERSMRAISR